MLNVEYRKVEALIPFARNPRTHTEAQVAKIAASIVEYGWTNPILVDGEHGVIAGHGRLAATRKLGLVDVPVIELGHLSSTQKRAYVISDNRLALDAGWNEELLALELAELSEAGYDLALTGFDDAEIEQLLVGDVAVGDGNEQDADAPDAADDVPEVSATPVSRFGDVWQLGEHRLICGDAADAGVIALLMAGEEAVLCFTSPPYGNQRDYTGVTQDWDTLMRNVFAQLPMAANGQVLINLGLIHREQEGSCPTGTAGSTGCAVKGGGALPGTSGIRGRGCPETGMAGFHRPSNLFFTSTERTAKPGVPIRSCPASMPGAIPICVVTAPAPAVCATKTAARPPGTTSGRSPRKPRFPIR